MVGKGFLRFGVGFKEGDGGAEIPQLGQSVVAVGIPQDDKPVLRDDNVYLEE
jgi:hypothetical protein